MNRKKVNKIFKKVAEMEGVSPSFVKNEIEVCLAAAHANQDPYIQNEWKLIPCKGDVPTLNEFLTYVMNNVGREIPIIFCPIQR